MLIKDAAKQMAINAVAGAVLGPLASRLAPALENLPLLRQVPRVVSNNTVKHLINRGHLAEFQKLNPGVTMDGIIQLGIDVAETGSQVGVKATWLRLTGKERDAFVWMGRLRGWTILGRGILPGGAGHV